MQTLRCYYLEHAVYITRVLCREEDSDNAYPERIFCTGVHRDPMSDGNKTRIPHTLNALCARHHNPTLDRNWIPHTLNAYRVQDIATRRQYRQKARIPHTPECMLCTVASRPDYVYAYTTPKVAGHGPCGRPWCYYTDNLAPAD